MSGSYAVGANYLAYTGSSAGAAGSGAFTLALLVNPGVGNNNAGFMALLNGTTERRGFGEASLSLYGANDFSSGVGPLTQGNWYVVAVTKPAGANPYRMHFWAWNSGGTGSFTHAVASGAANQSDPGAATNIRIGAASVAQANGLIAVAAVWTSALSDAQIDTLISANLTAWTALSPQELISLENWNGSSGSLTVTGTAAFSAVNGTVGAGANPTGFNFSTGGGTQTLTGTGIASGEALGAGTVTPGPVTLTGSGIASGEALGAGTVTPGAVTLTGTGIASGAAFGAGTVTPGPVTVTGTGIASAEALGAGAVTAGPVSLAGTGIASGGAFGAGTVSPGPVAIVGAGIGSGEAFGAGVVSAGGAILAGTGIPSGAAFGAGLVATGPVQLTGQGIPSGMAFGSGTITGGEATGQLLGGVGIPSAEHLGHGYVTRLGEGVCDCEADTSAVLVRFGRGRVSV